QKGKHNLCRGINGCGGETSYVRALRGAESRSCNRNGGISRPFIKKSAGILAQPRDGRGYRPGRNLTVLRARLGRNHLTRLEAPALGGLHVHVLVVPPLLDHVRLPWVPQIDDHEILLADGTTGGRLDDMVR